MFYARQAPGGRTLLDRPSHNIQQLAPLAAASLSAGHSVHSFAYAVVQCCENSLDAHAASVTVTIDLGRLTARVVDDGQGIPVASFPLLGQRNCGSKQQAAAQQVHSSTDASAAGPLGRLGSFLASLAEAAQVEITSKAAGAFQTLRKTLAPGDPPEAPWWQSATFWHVSPFAVNS